MPTYDERREYNMFIDEQYFISYFSGEGHG